MDFEEECHGMHFLKRNVRLGLLFWTGEYINFLPFKGTQRARGGKAEEVKS